MFKGSKTELKGGEEKGENSALLKTKVHSNTGGNMSATRGGGQCWHLLSHTGGIWESMNSTRGVGKAENAA